jgi:hypothetical protein
MKNWIKGGLTGGVIIFSLFLFFWVFISMNENCLLHFGQVYNLGGADCGSYGREIVYSSYYGKSFLYPISGNLIALFIPILLGFILGASISSIFLKIKSFLR